MLTITLAAELLIVAAWLMSQVMTTQSGANDLFLLDLGNGCGAIILNKDGIVVDGAPYFLKFLKGKHLLTELKGRYYRLEKLNEK